MERDQEIKNINIEEIIPNRFQPRLSFEPEALKELSESIKQYGVFQPLVVRRVGNKYEIIAGERRYKASTQAGFKEVPCVIVDLDDNESAEIALVENLQRKDLTPIEEAKSYQKLLDRGYINQDQLAKRMGKSQSAVANKIRLLNLAEEVQQALLETKISERHARSLLSIKNKEKQIEMLNRIITNRMTVKDTDAEVKKMMNEEVKTPDFIPIKSEVPTISLEELNNIQPEIKSEEVINIEPNILTMPIEVDEQITPQIEDPNYVDIEKLTKSTQDINQIPAKPDIMDLLRVEEQPTYEQMPIIESVEPTNIEIINDNEIHTSEEWSQPIRETVEPIPTISVDQIPLAMESIQPEIVVEEQPLIFEQPVFAIPKEEETIANVETAEEVTSIPVMGQMTEQPFVYENPQQPIAEIYEEPIAQVTASQPVTNNLRNAINMTRDCVNNLEKYGFNVDKEELDLTDSYQIIIKIIKTDV